MAGATLENMAVTQTVPSENWKPTRGYRFHILLVPEEDRSYSAIVLNLPGIGSCGVSEEEAIENVKEAIRAALDEYGDSIPWKDTSSEKIPAGAKQRWIVLDA
jgi:predicted RNase H-like HicB family nuclease